MVYTFRRPADGPVFQPAPQLIPPQPVNDPPRPLPFQSAPYSRPAAFAPLQGSAPNWLFAPAGVAPPFIATLSPAIYARLAPLLPRYSLFAPWSLPAAPSVLPPFPALLSPALYTRAGSPLPRYALFAPWSVPGPSTLPPFSPLLPPFVYARPAPLLPQYPLYTPWTLSADPPPLGLFPSAAYAARIALPVPQITYSIRALSPAGGVITNWLIRARHRHRR